MPRIRLLASSLALAICTITAAHAQEFTGGVISFGDSLSDDGNVAALSGDEAGNSFTTNPDPEAVQIIASAFGFSQTNFSPLVPGSNGTDFAYGGACIEANSATFTCGLSPGAFSLTTQITSTDPNDPGYLALNGGHADPNALYTMWGGANDIFTYLGLAQAGFITPTQAAIGTATAAGTEAGLIGILQNAGAKNIVVFNLPDIGKTPEFLNTAGQASATDLVLIFNSQLNKSMAGKTGIIPVDTFGLVNEVLANPTMYGFTNVTDPACGAGSSSVKCGPTGDANDQFHYAPGTDMTYFFADGVHPTGGAGMLLAEAVLSEIAAPSYVSMLSETPFQTFETQNRALYDQMQADMGGNRADGTMRSFASIDYSRQRYDVQATSPEMVSKDDTLVIGGDYYIDKNISFGVSSTFSHQDASFGNGGSFENNEPMIAGWGYWHTQDYYLSVIGAVGQLNFNGIDRAIQLGPVTRIETGNTDGSHVGFELSGGYQFHFGDMDTGPFATLSHQRVRVGSYNENGDDSTAMVFGRQDVDSTIGKVGWELLGNSKMGSGDIHPFARVAYNHEYDTDAHEVTAGLVTLNGTFTLPGYTPDSSYWSGELGVSASMGNNFTAYAAYNGHFGDSTERVDSLNVGFKFSW